MQILKGEARLWLPLLLVGVAPRRRHLGSPDSITLLADWLHCVARFRQISFTFESSGQRARHSVEM